MAWPAGCNIIIYTSSTIQCNLMRKDIASGGNARSLSSLFPPSFCSCPFLPTFSLVPSSSCLLLPAFSLLPTPCWAWSLLPAHLSHSTSLFPDPSSLLPVPVFLIPFPRWKANADVNITREQAVWDFYWTERDQCMHAMAWRRWIKRRHELMTAECVTLMCVCVCVS